MDKKLTIEQLELIHQRAQYGCCNDYMEMRAKNGHSKLKNQLINSLKAKECTIDRLILMDTARNERQEALFNLFLKQRIEILIRLSQILEMPS